MFHVGKRVFSRHHKYGISQLYFRIWLANEYKICLPNCQNFHLSYDIQDIFSKFLLSRLKFSTAILQTVVNVADISSRYVTDFITFFTKSKCIISEDLSTASFVAFFSRGLLIDCPLNLLLSLEWLTTIVYRTHKCKYLELFDTISFDWQ